MEQNTEFPLVEELYVFAVPIRDNRWAELHFSSIATVAGTLARNCQFAGQFICTKLDGEISKKNHVATRISSQGIKKKFVMQITEQFKQKTLFGGEGTCQRIFWLKKRDSKIACLYLG